MPDTTQQRRARVDSEMGAPKTIATQTAERETQTAENLVATKAARDGRHELRKASPDWPLQKDNFPEAER